ncbi:hypothetical protein EVG20_g9483 [Dentipellis fragilis]|uniref:BTB domain-containing protein n=1 Tax=Dentipellis fragilis TaxID=205917 RepID=A0A4Y9Y280_9AGAM|nr:hypothetical protein EVG20_g9483 [Dentipellis fragilis]
MPTSLSLLHTLHRIDIMSNSEQPDVAVTHNERYYTSDELMIIQVQNNLFRVHRAMLEKYSDVFRDMFAPAPTSSSEGMQIGLAGEGKSDDAPIVLPDVTVFEFETLLDEIYRGHKAETRIIPNDAVNASEPHPPSRARGLALLAIAHRFGVTINHPPVMSEIASGDPRLDAIERIVIAERFDVPMQHICASLVKLVRRANPLSRQEMGRISLDTLANVVQARELYRGLPSGGTEPEAFRIVNSIFQLTGTRSEMDILRILMRSLRLSIAIDKTDLPGCASDRLFSIQLDHEHLDTADIDSCGPLLDASSHLRHEQLSLWPGVARTRPSAGDYTARSERHYVSDELMIFQVEDTLFRVHRSALEDHSPVFKDMFALGPTESNSGEKQDESSGEGKSDGKPIILPEVTAFEFETLLAEVYRVRSHGIRVFPNVNCDEQAPSRKYNLALLSVAHRFEVIVNYPKFDVPLEHIRQSLVNLVHRSETLSSQEMRRVSYDTLAKIVEARETYKPIRAYRDSLKAIKIVNDVFGIPVMEKSATLINEQEYSGPRPESSQPSHKRVHCICLLLSAREMSFPIYLRKHLPKRDPLLPPLLPFLARPRSPAIAWSSFAYDNASMSAFSASSSSFRITCANARRYSAFTMTQTRTRLMSFTQVDA